MLFINISFFTFIGRETISLDYLVLSSWIRIIGSPFAFGNSQSGSGSKVDPYPARWSKWVWTNVVDPGGSGSASATLMINNKIDNNFIWLILFFWVLKYVHPSFHYYSLILGEEGPLRLALLVSTSARSLSANRSSGHLFKYVCTCTGCPLFNNLCPHRWF